MEYNKTRIMKNFIVVHVQDDPKQPELTTKFLINPLTGQSIEWEFINN
jgi:hypothetical protein